MQDGFNMTQMRIITIYAGFYYNLVLHLLHFIQVFILFNTEVIANYAWFITIQCCVYYKVILDSTPFTSSFISIYYCFSYYIAND